jgi:DNA-binding NtrC family response regulator
MSEPAAASPPRRVLVVDDEAEVCNLLHAILADAGYDPICAQGDTAAYEALEAERGSIVALVVDINLGQGTTGYDVARHARRVIPEVPVVYITGGYARSLESHGVPGGVLVSKPFDRELMLQTLAERLGP